MARSTGQKLLSFDRRLGARFVAGADEAGRGSLAGPLVVAGVLLDYECLRNHRVRPLGDLNDSKQVSPPEREELFRRYDLESMQDYRRAREEGRIPRDTPGDVFLVIDGWATFREEYDALDYAVDEIAARGGAYGVHVVLTVTQSMQIRMRMQPSFGGRLELRLNDVYDSQFGRKVMEQIPKEISGRGAMEGERIFQAAVPRIDGVRETEREPDIARRDTARAGEHREVLEAFRMFAHDHGWRRGLDEALLTGLTAEAAVQRVRNDTRARMLRLPDPRLRDRLHDIDDLSNRLLRLLSGGVGTAATGSLPQDAIVVARTMGPAELLDYDRQRLRGLVLEEGGAASHVAIVARALGIAAMTQVKAVLESVEPGDAAIVDSEGGELHIRPTQEVVSAYADKVRFRARRQAQYAALRTVPSVTLDGERVAIQINAGLLFDLPHLDQSGADGIGLFRTELQFMISATFPRLEQQTRLYKAILDAAGDRPVVFRSLDVGGAQRLAHALGDRHSRFHRRDYGVSCFENAAVHLLLFRRKASRDRPRARDVGGVVFIVSAVVHVNNLAILHLAIVIGVMQYHRVWS